jgi:rhodanese-related sulfurtransferase
MALPAPATRPQRGLHFLANLGVFSLCYPLANLAAQRAHASRHLALALDGAIPFWPWMIVPYLSSGLFFALSFAWVRSADDLRVLSRRLLLASVAASLVFLLYPLQFSVARPPVSPALPAALFGYLDVWDRPYNQLPSLHVAFCLIIWQSLRAVPRSAWTRAALGLWLALVALSTVFTYQHHLLDVGAGLLLGLAALALVRPGRMRHGVAFHYLMGAGVVLACALFLGWPALLYVVASLLLVSRAYWRSERHFLRKEQGRHPLWIWLLYAPYLAGYWLTWRCVRLRERGRAPWVQRSAQLWVGRRLDVAEAEAARLPPACVVFDLCPELAENAVLRAHPYRHFPLLDLEPPAAAAIADIVAALALEIGRGRSVYLHCAMGYSRSIFIAQCYFDKYPR